MNDELISDKKHKHEHKDKQSSKHSNQHKSHSSGNEKTDKTHNNKHRRAREPDQDLVVTPKKHKNDSSTTLSSRCDEKKSSKSKYQHADNGIEIDNSMGTSFADALGKTIDRPVPLDHSTSICFYFC